MSAAKWLGHPGPGSEIADRFQALREAAGERIIDPEQAASDTFYRNTAAPHAVTQAARRSSFFFDGVRSHADALARSRQALGEVAGLYNSAVDAVADQPAMGPDGMSTVRQLETERQSVSQLIRKLERDDNFSMQYAIHHGLDLDSLRAREAALHDGMEPALRQTGLDPRGVWQALGDIQRVGESLERMKRQPSQPFGFSKLLKVNTLKNLVSFDPHDPASVVENAGPVWDATKDFLAGRVRESPLDVNIRESFRQPQPKPDFGNLRQGSPDFFSQYSPEQGPPTGEPSSVFPVGDSTASNMNTKLRSRSSTGVRR